MFVLLVPPVDQRDRPFVKVHTQRERMRQGSYGVEGLCQLFFVEKMTIGIAGHPEGSPDISDCHLLKITSL